MIAIGSDHGGYDLKEKIKKYLEDSDIKYEDLGCYGTQSCDYPDYAKAVAEGVASGKYREGILVCGTGIGMSIAANKVKGIRAALCSDEFSARKTREHNNANILCIGARVTADEKAISIVDIFLNTPFSNEERHIRRINKIEE